MPQTLGQLLRDADAGQDVPPASHDIAPLIRRRHRRRVIVWRAMTMAALILSISLLTLWTTRSRQLASSIPLPPGEGRVRASVENVSHDWDAVAQLHELTAEKLSAAPRRRSHSIASATPEVELQFQRDRAALILVYDADRFARENRPEAALTSYRRAIELFPQTHWAAVARQRIQEMQS